MAEWELNQADKETLRPQLANRCTEAVRKYLLYLQGTGSDERKAWAKDNMNNVSSLGVQMTNYLTSEPTFIAGGTGITDTAIKDRVEFVLNSYFLPA